MSLPLVSIVIPAFNAGRFLAQCVDSVLAQDYPAVEAIVIDDGSTDDTRSRMAQYGARIYLETQANAGQSAAINRGWARARGEILSYLGADDALRPDAVRRSVEVLATWSRVVMTYGDYDLIDSRSTMLRRVRAPEYSYWGMLGDLVCAPGPGVFIRRSAWEATGGWDSSLHQIPDLDYWLRLCRAGPFFHIPEVLASFRVHEASATFSPNVEWADEPVRVIERIYRSGQVPTEFEWMRPRSLAAAHLMTARAYLRNGAGVDACRHLIQAARQDPRTLVRPRTLRLLASGVFGRSYYRLLARRRVSGADVGLNTGHS